ncbi:lethal(3)malignant brain tumor-like protein 3 [Copidosoma floridanum]|uniref:lethal(3)malignant brain tumor-like protein 3 n=1 Tax=Copidosoma floridanum TaxID=29053 RepID=UPI0006C9CAE1|nr:lethal(3)malignant brain tumor-like protein 3 [Copidosoma floridanum]
MSMLYIQPATTTTSVTGNGGSCIVTSSAQAHPVVQAQSPQHQQPQQIAPAFDHQILLQGIAQSSSTQIPAQLFTIRRQVNPVTSPSASQAEKNILIRKTNASNAQIMPIGISEAQAQNQAGNKPKVTYLHTIIKPKPQDSVLLSPAGPLNAAQNIKQKVVFAPVYSQIPTSSTSSSLQSPPPKHMTNLLLPVSINQPSIPAASKQNINIKSNFTLKLNNGQASNEPKNAITVLRESKTSNGTTNPPPLHPIANMSLINASKTGHSSTDGVKINENPDSAVITPIPKKDESISNSSEKRKRPTSNILRSEKRMRKQSFTKTNQDLNVVDVSNYALNSSESEHEKDKRKDKESDDDITLIKVVPSEDKRMKRLSMSDEVKIEVVRGLNRNGVEVIEKIERVNGKSSSDDARDQKKSDITYPEETSQILHWDDGIGTLIGTSLKFRMNEFGYVQCLEDDKKGKSKNFGDKENVYLTQNSKSGTSTIVKTEESKSQNPTQDDKTFCHCQGCGCHGPISDFYNHVACSSDCAQYIEMKQQKIRKDKESKQEIRAKKKRKKLLEQASKEEEEKAAKVSNSKLKYSHEKLRDSDEKFDKFHMKEKSISDEDTKDTNTSMIDEESPEESEAKYPWLTGKNKFSWLKYLEFTKAKAAPTKLFKDAFPEGKNNFKVGMKLEGIDPNHPSDYCVLSIAEVIGYRIRLHFDGYPENFDFWVNADCMDIFPVGWAEKNGRQIHPPKGYNQSNFNWNTYLKTCKAQAAPKTMFANKNATVLTGFRVGMKLEAVDRKHSSLVCVASVADVLDSRILVHFDSWDDIYDYWADVSSPYIHPVGWCHHNGRSLTPPNYYKDAKAFSWDEYLKSTNSIAAPARAFKQRTPCGFKRGMKLEAVDKRLPQLIRVTTVEDVKDHLLKIRFDGWPESHGYWVDDDSPDIHPMGWCSKTGHPLEPPITQDNLTNRPECGTFGCRGIGHVKGPKFATHNSASGCPYSPQNVARPKTMKDRLNIKHEVNDFEDEGNVERNRFEKVERNKSERLEKRFPSFEEKLIKTENIKQEVDYMSDKNEKLYITDRFRNKWHNNSDGQSDEEECTRKRKKRKNKNESNNLSFLNSSNDSRAYALNIPEKQFRTEIYQSVYHPGYNPTPPDTQQLWAKHSGALNKVVAKQTTNPLRWSNEEVVKFVQSLPNCKDLGNIFRQHNVDGDAFMALSQDDLVSHIGLKLGPAIKVYNSIYLLRKKVT